MSPFHLVCWYAVKPLPADLEAPIQYCYGPRLPTFRRGIHHGGLYRITLICPRLSFACSSRSRSTSTSRAACAISAACASPHVSCQLNSPDVFVSVKPSRPFCAGTTTRVLVSRSTSNSRIVPAAARNLITRAHRHSGNQCDVHGRCRVKQCQHLRRLFLGLHALCPDVA